MSTSSEKVLQLRQLLAERFGQAPLAAEEIYSTGLPCLDEIAIPRGALTEIVLSPASSSGGMLVLYGVLHSAAHRQERVILVDGSDSFQPQGLFQEDMERLLWTRCRSAQEAVRAVDLAARDGNFSLVVVLLVLNPPSELRRIGSNVWHRLQMLAEKSGATLLVFTRSPLAGCAKLRISAGGDFPILGLHRRRVELLPSLRLRLERRRLERSDHEAVRRSVCA